MLDNMFKPDARVGAIPIIAPQTTSDTPSPTPALPEIPSDLYETIIEHCDARTLARCLRVCKLFHHHAVSRLYRSIAIRIEDGGATEPEAAGRLAREIPSRFLPLAHSLVDAAVPITSIVPPSSFFPSPTLDRSSTYHPERESLAWHIFTYTKHLTINPHSPSDCQHHAPLIIPNLISLRVLPGTGAASSCCRSNVTLYGRMAIPKSNCTLAAGLRPRRYIVGSGGFRQFIADTQMPIAGVWPSQGTLGAQETPPWVKEIMILMDEHSAMSLPHYLSEMCEEVSSSVERLVLVMVTDAAIWQGRGHTWGWEAAPLDQKLGNSFSSPTNVTRALASASSGRAQVVEIVGAETRSDVVNERSVLRIQREIRNMLQQRLIKHGWKETAAQARAEGIVFTSAQEFQDD